ncbi:MAG: ABC transporter permease [Acidimicrobiales bacterium]|nr:ABC transporter permease [Acidimicrobiales bacterium]MCB9393173.1 ABC transporter permease [Acidimicrobiaceae bacterium]
MASRLGRGTLGRFVMVRLAATVVLLLALSFVVFALLYLAPGDPARNLLGPRNPSPELLAAIRAEYHLDDPFVTQYVRWIGDVVRGDLGTSIRSEIAVTSLLADRVVLTAELAIMAFVITLVVAVPLGVRAAWRAGSVFDRTVSLASIVGVGAPSYAVGLLLLYLLGVRFQLFPVYGIGDGGLDQLWHLVLPAVTLAIGIGALVFKLTRTAVLGELEQDYVAFARARGLSEGAVRRLVLRNALIPVVTSGGLVFAFLFGGTILVEVTFALPGIGGLLAGSVTFKDIPVVQAITLLTATVIALTALAVDIVTYTIDPRVRARGLR